MNTEINKLVDLYESELKSGGSPTIESFIAKVPDAHHKATLKELIGLDVFYRIKQQQPVRISDYARFGQEAAVFAEQAIADNYSNGENAPAWMQLQSEFGEVGDTRKEDSTNSTTK